MGPRLCFRIGLATFLVLGPLAASPGGAPAQARTIEAKQRAAPAPAVAAWLGAALDTMEAHALRRHLIDWPALRRATLERAAGAHTTVDAYDALRFALRELGDGHSFLQLPDSLSELERRRHPERAGSDDAPASPSPFATRRTLTGDLHRRGDAILARVVIPSFGGTNTAPYASRLHGLIEGLDRTEPCGWVVDLRGNGGGNMWPMLAGVGPLLGTEEPGEFVGPGRERIAWFYRDGAAGTLAPDGAAQVASRMNASGRPYVLSGVPPVAVLVDRGTGSSGEAVAVAFRGRPHTRFFGEPTAGLSTANRGFRLGDGANLVLTVGVYVDRTGAEYPAGIEPDLVVSEGDTGDDAVLSAALEWLSGGAACRAMTRG